MTTQRNATIRTFIDERDGKYGPAKAMVRLVTELLDRLDETGSLEQGEHDGARGIQIAFEKTLPKRVREDR